MTGKSAPSAEETEYLMLKEELATKERKVMERAHELAHKRATYPDVIMKLFAEKKALRMKRLTKEVQAAEKTNDGEAKRRILEKKVKICKDMEAESKRLKEELAAMQKESYEKAAHSALILKSLTDPFTAPVLPEHRIRMTATEFPFLAE